MTKESELNDRYFEKIEEWREASRVLRQKERELVAIEVEMDDGKD